MSKILTFCYTGQTRISYSNIRDTVTNTKYKRNIVKPNPLFIRHLKKAILNITNSNIQKRIAILQTIPTEFTSTGVPYINPYKSHGTGSLKKKILFLVINSR